MPMPACPHKLFASAALRLTIRPSALPRPPRILSMLWAVDYQQHLDPLARFGVPWSSVWSTIFAGLPVLVLFYLLVPRRWPAPRAGAAAALCALVVAATVYGMPTVMAILAFLHGAPFGLVPVGWTIFNAMLLYHVTVETAQVSAGARSVPARPRGARSPAARHGCAPYP